MRSVLRLVVRLVLHWGLRWVVHSALHAAVQWALRSVLRLVLHSVSHLKWVKLPQLQRWGLPTERWRHWMVRRPRQERPQVPPNHRRTLPRRQTKRQKTLEYKWCRSGNF